MKHEKPEQNPRDPRFKSWRGDFNNLKLRFLMKALNIIFAGITITLWGFYLTSRKGNLLWPVFMTIVTLFLSWFGF